jgi:predicted transcriptional regulator
MLKKATSVSRRERQIMEILFRRGRATAAEVLNCLSGDPHYSTVRTQLRILEDKGLVRHEEENLKYVYSPVVERHELGQSMLMQLVDTFFDGSMENVVSAMLGYKGAKLSKKELDRIADIVARARKGARR